MNSRTLRFRLVETRFRYLEPFWRITSVEYDRVRQTDGRKLWKLQQRALAASYKCQCQCRCEFYVDHIITFNNLRCSVCNSICSKEKRLQILSERVLADGLLSHVDWQLVSRQKDQSQRWPAGQYWTGTVAWYVEGLIERRCRGATSEVGRQNSIICCTAWQCSIIRRQ